MLMDESEDLPFEYSVSKADMNEEKNSDDRSYFSSSLMTAPKDFQTHSSTAFLSKDFAHKSDTSGNGKKTVFVYDMSSTLYWNS